jgi:hypothetical protein
MWSRRSFEAYETWVLVNEKPAMPCAPPAPTWVNDASVESLIRSALAAHAQRPGESVMKPRWFSQAGPRALECSRERPHSSVAGGRADDSDETHVRSAIPW